MRLCLPEGEFGGLNRLLRSLASSAFSALISSLALRSDALGTAGTVNFFAAVVAYQFPDALLPRNHSIRGDFAADELAALVTLSTEDSKGDGWRRLLRLCACIAICYAKA